MKVDLYYTNSIQGDKRWKFNVTQTLCISWHLEEKETKRDTLKENQKKKNTEWSAIR